MKVRLSESGVRIRLSPEDLRRLPRESLRLNVPLGSGERWECSLGLVDGTFRTEANAGSLSVWLPRAEAEGWLQGRELEWHLESGSLKLAVEKDAKPGRP